MKFSRYCLIGMFVFLCLFGSCSMGETELEDFLTTEETSKEEGKTTLDEETLSEEENPDETQDETQDNSEEIPPVPIFLYCKTVSEKEIVFGFSQPVKMVELCLSIKQKQKIALEQEIILEHEIAGTGKTITVNLAENLESGQLLSADFQAEDAYGNNVEKQVLFSSTVTNAPALQINELRTEFSKPKAEYIELKMLSDGNLGSLSVFAAGNDKNAKIFEFAPLEVKAGEYIVLHLRTFEESCKDEYGERLDESEGADSSPTARDFWISGSTELLRKTDAVYVLDQDGWVLDAVMVCDSPSSVWSKSYLSEAAEFLFSQGAWKSPADTVCTPADAVNSSGTTVTRSISRKETEENTHTAADWYVTATSGATPGLPNKP